MALSYDAPQVAALKAQSKFQVQVEKFSKSVSRLYEAIDHASEQFAPVIGPSIGACCEKDAVKEPTPPQSDFEAFIDSMSKKIYNAAQRIDTLCEMSTV